MRSEQEMFDLIVQVAQADNRIRAVLLVGSRANPDCPKDMYQDYDITYFVTDMEPFYNHMDWVEAVFGAVAIVQLPELMKHPLLPPEGDGHFTYLMLFADGVRVDLNVQLPPYINDGEPAVVLLDKDGILPVIAVNPAYYYVKPPQERVYYDACNEFWWCLNNVAKGIARDELPYAMEMFNHYVRDMLHQMTEWYIGVCSGFSVSAGKCGKYFKRYLPDEVYAQYVSTYSDGVYVNLRRAVEAACDLFHQLACEVAAEFGFAYHQGEEDAIRHYLKVTWG